jgi:hypothetical protein
LAFDSVCSAVLNPVRAESNPKRGQSTAAAGNDIAATSERPVIKQRAVVFMLPS